MSVAVAAEYLEGIAHLPKGMTLRTDGVSWDEYEELLHDLGPTYQVRIFYDHGRMEIVSSRSIHERPVEILQRLIIAISDQLDIDIESLGSTTLKKQMADAGAEPAASFYVQNAALIHDYLDLDIEHDPPSDLVIESDHTSSSLDKFVIYTNLEVPEIWRIFNQRVGFWILENNRYIESDHSRTFPFLSAAMLNQFLQQGLMEGERKAAKSFRAWINSTRA